MSSHISARPRQSREQTISVLHHSQLLIPAISIIRLEFDNINKAAAVTVTEKNTASDFKSNKTDLKAT